MECCVPAIGTKVFFYENTLLCRLAHAAPRYIRPSFRNEVNFGTTQRGRMLQGGPRAVWVVGDFSERSLILVLHSTILLDKDQINSCSEYMEEQGHSIAGLLTSRRWVCVSQGPTRTPFRILVDSRLRLAVAS